CYVVRAGTGQQATANLTSRQPGASLQPALIARAIQEGTVGNVLSVQIVESSLLAAQLGALVPSRNISAVSTNRLTLTLDNTQGYGTGEQITIAKPGNQTRTAIVDSVDSNNNTLKLENAIPGNEDYKGGTISSAGVLALWRVETQATAINQERTQLTVNDKTGFARDDRILLKKGNNETHSIVADGVGKNTLVLTAPVPNTINFGTPGAVTVRTDDLTPGRRTFRLVRPAGVSLSQVLPPGAAVRISLGNKTEIRIVDASGGNSITLAE